MEQLLQQWGGAIAPEQNYLMTQLLEQLKVKRVKVRYTGYQGDKLLPRQVPFKC